MKSLRVRVAVGVLIGGLIVLLGFTGSGKRVSTAGPINVSLRFGGFSTNAAAGVLAMFSMSNSNPWKVNYRAGLIQAKINGSWSQVQITPGEMKIIRPDESINFLVPVPETTRVWRVPVVVSRGLSRAEGLLHRTRLKIATVTGNSELAPGLTCYTNFTPEISR